MPRCRFNKKTHCGYDKCRPDCEVLIKSRQQILFTEQPQVIETKKRKGHTTSYYKVKK